MNNIHKIGIMSDSHDNLPAIRAAVELFNKESMGLVLHAGDVISPFTAREMKKLTCHYEITLGNNDGEILGLYKIYEGHIHHSPFTLKLNDKSILVLHDPILLPELTESQSYDIIIYGHDHTPKIDRLADGTLIINPGECGGWLNGRHTVAIYDIIRDKAEIIELQLTT